MIERIELKSWDLDKSLGRILCDHWLFHKYDKISTNSKTKIYTHKISSWRNFQNGRYAYQNMLSNVSHQKNVNPKSEGDTALHSRIIITDRQW